MSGAVWKCLLKCTYMFWGVSVRQIPLHHVWTYQTLQWICRTILLSPAVHRVSRSQLLHSRPVQQACDPSQGRTWYVLFPGQWEAGAKTRWRLRWASGGRTRRRGRIISVRVQRLKFKGKFGHRGNEKLIGLCGGVDCVIYLVTYACSIKSVQLPAKNLMNVQYTRSSFPHVPCTSLVLSHVCLCFCC